MMRWRLVLVLALAIPCAWDALAQEVPKSEAPKPPGDTRTRTSTTPRRKAAVSTSVGIGDDAPGFELDAADGRSVRPSNLRGEWVVLAFSDRWKPMSKLDAATEPLRRMGTRLVGICHEKPQTLTSVTRRDSLRLLLLADPTGEVSGLYNLFDWGRGETQPGFFVLDRTGVVRLAMLGRVLPADQMVETVQFLQDAHRAYPAGADR
jgi:peroxiredoxin